MSNPIIDIPMRDEEIVRAVCKLKRLCKGTERKELAGLADVKLIGGMGKSFALSIDGNQLYPWMYEFELTIPCFRQSIPNLYKAGIRIFKPYLNVFPTWIDDDRYDYRFFDVVMELIVSGAPEGYIWPHIALTPGDWWGRRHPEELRVTDSPELKHGHAMSSPHCPSMGSKLWRKQTARAFEELITHIEQSWYGRRIVGIHLSCGHASEWIEPAWVNDRWAFGDWHKETKKAFREFVRRTCKCEYQSAHVPKRCERFVSDMGTFLDPSKRHLVSLWYKFLTEQTLSVLNEIAGVVKQSSKNRLLTSAFGGYFFQAGRCAYLYADAISFAISKYFSLTNLDALETPYGYDNRKLDGDCTLRNVPEVFAEHGKLFINQNDQRTHLTRGVESVWGSPETASEAVETLKRNVGRVLTRNSGQSWFDFGYCWFDDSTYLKSLSRLLKLGEKSFNWGQEHVDGLGVVIDDESLFHQRMANTLMFRLMYQQVNEYFNRIGVAWYVYHINDLLSGTIKLKHKTWLFLNTFYLTSKQRKQIRKVFCKDKRTIIWIYAPGFQSPKGLSVSGIRELTGMKVKLLPVAASGQITITDFNDPITKGIDPSSRYALLGARDIDDKESIIEPMFYVDDSEAKILGKLEAVNLPGLAVKRFADWTSIYAPTSKLNEMLYRNICKSAGTHIYCDSGDLLYVHPNLIVLVSKSAGKKMIHLSRRCNVRDAIVGKTIFRKSNKIEFSAGADKTYIFELF